MTAPTCTDGIQNGNETGVDCGGPDCPACPTATVCGAGSNVLNLCLEEVCDVIQNGNFCMDLTASNFTNITGLQFIITYPAANLEYVSFTSPALGTALQFNEFADGNLRAIFVDADQGGESFTDGTVIATICFTNETAGSTSVEFASVQAGDTGGMVAGATGNDGSVNAAGCNGNTSTCSDGIQNGNETGVDCGGPDCAACPMTECGEGTTDVEICIGSVCADAGAEICVPVMVGNFDNLGGLQFSLEYTAGNLDFERFTAHPSLQNGTTAGSSADGIVTLVWNDPNLAGVSLDPTDLAFELCFTAENTNPTPLTFRNPSSTLRVFNTVGGRLDASGNPGAVNQNCGSAPTCTDGVQNGNETGVDCGGPDCTPCMTAPTCTDGIQNGNETGIDCGGPDCAPCMSDECGAGSSNFNLCIEDVCNIPVNGNFCLDLTVTNFTNITGLQFRLAYPAANLDFVSFSSPSALGPALQFNENADGDLRAIYVDADQSGETLPANTVLAVLCFTNQTTAPTTIDVASLQVGNTGGMVSGAVGNDGLVNAAGCNGGGSPSCTDGIRNGNETGVDCGGPDCSPCMTAPTCSDGIQNGNETGVDCGGPDCAPCMADECGAGSSNFNLCIEDACNIPVNGNFCVDVTVTNFTNITGLQFRFAYPAANLDFVSFTSPSALGSALQFNENADGDLRAIYVDADQSGETLPANTVIATLCFTNQTTAPTTIDVASLQVGNTGGMVTGAIGNDGLINAAGCSGGGGGNPTCSDGIQNGNETGVDCGGPDCAPCGGSGGGGTCGEDTDVFSVCIGDACDVALNGQACVDIFVGNFTNIVGFQMDILYPGANLEFTSFTSSVLGSELQGNDFSDGNVRLVFFNAPLTGVTLDDGTSIGTLCFTNETSGTTILDGDNLRGSDTNGMFSNPLPIVNDGMVNGCSNEPSCSNGIKDGNEEGIDCGGDCPNACPTGATPAFNVSSNTAAVGDEVCINVNVADFTNLGSVAMTLNYDASALEFVSVSGNASLASFGASNFNTNTAGRIVVNYNPSTAQTLADGQAFFTVCFTLRDGEATTVNLTNIAVTDGGGNNLTTSTNSGTIMGTVSFDNLTLVAGSASGAAGTEVCVDVTVFNLEGLASLQFAISYEEDKLSYTNGMGTGELPGLQVANPSPGILRAVWFDPNVGSNSVDDGNSIVRVCFNVLQECETPITITDDLPSFRIRASGPDNQPILPVDRVAGTVNAGATDCGNGGGSAPNLILQLGSASGLTGTEVCIDLTATNFTNLTDLGFSLNYDATKVTFARATNFGLPSINAGNVTNPSAGVIAFDWDSPVASGQSIPAGGRVVSLCFNVVRLSVTPVNFANSPVAIVARNGSGQAVGVVPNGGAINPNAPTTDGLTFQIGSAQAGVGEEICLPIIAFEAVDIVSFQYTINYDPARLEYIGTGPDYAFPGFTNGSVVNSQPGVLRVAWADNFANGTTVPDGSAVYTVCFRVLSTDLTLVSFGGSPTAIEFENEDDIIDDFTLLNGQVNGSTAPVIVSSVVQNPTCANGSDGSITLNVSGGPGLTYQWSPNVSNSDRAVGIPAGTYSVTISNGGATTEQSFTVSNPGPFALEVANVSGVSCNGERDGRITIATVGNNGPFTFDWSGNLQDGQGVNQQTGLDGGSYSVTVTDRNGCTRALNNIMIGEPAALNIAGSPFKITRDVPGGVTIEVSGGRAPFSYSWSGPNNYASNAEDIDDAIRPGTYCLTVTDNNNCTDTQCFGIVRDIDITSTIIEQGCPDEANGSIDISVTGGDGNYDYVWTSGGTTISTNQDVNNLAPGDYRVMITSGECQITQTITVEAPDPIRIPALVTAATSGNNGSIVLTPSGGNPPLSFAWDDGPTSQNRNNLAAGEYCVTATDDSDCSVSRCYTVGADATSILSVTSTATSCADTEDGTVVILIDNGSAPYEVRIAPLGTTQTFPDDNISIDLPGGTYTIFITDAQGAMLETMATVETPDPITATTTVTSDTETTGCSGMINLEVAGGTGPYTVAWSDGMTGLTRSLLCAGMYTPTITDANGCTFEPGTATVGRIDEELISVTEVACADGTEGGIDVTISGGATPYTFAWTRGSAPEVISTNEDLLASDVAGGVTAGDYTLTVTDATGASLTTSYNVGISAGFSVTTAVTSNYNGFGVSCAGNADGQIEIVISGQGDFMYEYILDGIMVGTDRILNNAAAGTYTVTVIDEGGCDISNTVEVTAPPALVLTETITGISCGSTNDGSIAVETTGGVAPYSYVWSTGATTARISGLGTGTYEVTVTDGNNCTNAGAYDLNAPEDLAITFEATDATDGCNGGIRVIPLGGSGNYRYSFPQLPNQGNDPVAEGLCPGVYEIIVTDENGCQSVTMVAEVLDRRFPCLSVREVITPNGDGLNEAFVITCSDGTDAVDNNLQIFNRWGQLVYRVANYDCNDDDRGLNCFEGRTNDGTLLPEGPYYYIFEFRNMLGEEMQQRGSLTILRD